MLQRSGRSNKRGTYHQGLLHCHMEPLALPQHIYFSPPLTQAGKSVETHTTHFYTEEYGSRCYTSTFGVHQTTYQCHYALLGWYSRLITRLDQDPVSQQQACVLAESLLPAFSNFGLAGLTEQVEAMQYHCPPTGPSTAFSLYVMEASHGDINVYVKFYPERGRILQLLYFKLCSLSRN